MKKVGIFVDHENLTRSLEERRYNFKVLLERAKKEGRVIVGKAYVPFLPDTYRGNSFDYSFYKTGICPIYAPSYSTGKSNKLKNLGDPMLICDVMESLYERPAIDVFIICSGDKDMIPLLRKIAEKGKDVVVIGVGPTSATALVEECTRLDFKFVDYLCLDQRSPRKIVSSSATLSRFPQKVS